MKIEVLPITSRFDIFLDFVKQRESTDDLPSPFSEEGQVSETLAQYKKQFNSAVKHLSLVCRELGVLNVKSGNLCRAVTWLHGCGLLSDNTLPVDCREVQDAKNWAKLMKLFEGTLSDQSKSSDMALYHLLRRWKDSLPTLDVNCHKSFRQHDTTSDGDTDMAIWHLLDGSVLFWKLYYEVMGKGNT